MIISCCSVIDWEATVTCWLGLYSSEGSTELDIQGGSLAWLKVDTGTVGWSTYAQDLHVADVPHIMATGFREGEFQETYTEAIRPFMTQPQKFL